MKRLCTICARGGSKGVKNKNIRSMLGKPLIAYSIIQARASGLFEDVAVSSDSEWILSISRQWGADILIHRPAEFSSDAAPKVKAIQHCLKETERQTGKRYDTIVDLDATSPLRKVADIQAAVRLLESRQVSNVITGTPARRSPYFNLVEVGDDGYVRLSKPMDTPVVRRQDAPRCYDMNASIYVWRREALLQQGTLFHHDTLLYEMPAERSFDIDTELDFEIVEFLMRKKGDLL